MNHMKEMLEKDLADQVWNMTDIVCKEKIEWEEQVGNLKSHFNGRIDDLLIRINSQSKVYSSTKEQFEILT